MGSLKVLLLSDTHGYFDETIFDFVKESDCVWHAGDFGEGEFVERVKSVKPLTGVYGNIDGRNIRSEFPEILSFEMEGVKVLMKHIGGYPGRYAHGVKQLLREKKPDLFISGHSHILKVQKDQDLGILHMNPGAAGRSGFHAIRTMIRFEIIDSTIKNIQVIELGKRSRS